MNLSRSSRIQYINGHSDSAPFLLAGHLDLLLQNYITSPDSPVFVCIGTDLVTGDSLGPLVGTVLQNCPSFPYSVYGTLSHPVHALNLRDTMEEISTRHPKSPVIAIDASLGTKKHLQYITIAPGALSPGAGVNKVLERVGDISITGIINLSGEYAHMLLQSTHPSTVMFMAECIARGILLAFSCSKMPMQIL